MAALTEHNRAIRKAKTVVDSKPCRMKFRKPIKSKPGDAEHTGVRVHRCI